MRLLVLLSVKFSLHSQHVVLRGVDVLAHIVLVATTLDQVVLMATVDVPTIQRETTAPVLVRGIYTLYIPVLFMMFISYNHVCGY